MKISKMANRIEPSLTRKLFDMAKKYDNVIDFTLGDPDYETPDYVKKAACDAIMAGKTKYAANAGIIELRKAAAKRIIAGSRESCVRRTAAIPKMPLIA